MKKLLTFVFFATLAFAQNPIAYAALGDVIYNNAVGIKKLQNIQSFEILKPKIKKYLHDVSKTKEYGFALDASKEKVTKKEYLNKLRELSTTNDFFIRSAKSTYKNALEQNDSELFSQILDTGLIDIKDNLKEIKTFYLLHSDEINASEYVKSYLDSDEKLQEELLKAKKAQLTHEQIEAMNIKRIRENDKAKREALQKALDEEVIRKKIKIREEQKKELMY